MSSKRKGGRKQPQQPQQQIPMQIPSHQHPHHPHQQPIVYQQAQQQQHPQQILKTSGQQVILNEPDPKKRWHTIYPQYINSNLTRERGRRLPKSKCIADPLAEEIFNVLAANPQQFEVQLNLYKCYNRELDKENLRTRGYIKYRLINQNESNQNQFKNKKQILHYICSLIPKLKSRQNPKALSSSSSSSGSNQGGQGGNTGGASGPGQQDNNNSSSSSTTAINTMGGQQQQQSSGGGGQQQSGSGNTGGGGNKKKNRRK